MSGKKLLGFGIGAVVFLVVVYSGIDIYVTGIAEQRIHEVLADARRVADVTYEKIDVSLWGKDVRISGVTISAKGSNEPIHVDEFIIHEFDDESEVPEFLSVSCNGIQLDMDVLSKKIGTLQKLGYKKKMAVDLNIDYRFDRAKESLAVNNLEIKAKGAGSLKINLRLGNLRLDDLDELLGNFPRVSFKEAKIIFQDDSLTNRLLKLGANETRMSEKDFKKFVFREIDKKMEREKDDFTRKALGGMKRFLDSPKELLISASPSTPLTINRILNVRDPNGVVNLLKIKIES